MVDDGKKRAIKPSTLARQKAFLAAYSICGSVTHAADHAGIHRQTHIDWLNSAVNSEEYAKWFEEAKQAFHDSLENEARRRAVEGIRDLVLYKGEPVFVWMNSTGEVVPQGSEGAIKKPLYTTKWSDTMLAMLLNGHLPKKYRYARAQYEDEEKQPDVPISEVMRQCLDEIGDKPTDVPADQQGIDTNQGDQQNSKDE